jgi:site-specific recombinase XerD
MILGTDGQEAGSHLRGIRCAAGPDRWEGWTGGLAVRTRSEYARDVEQWEAFLTARGKVLLDARPGDVNGWTASLRARGCKTSTVARKLSAISSYYAWAREEGLTEVDPMPRRRPKVRHDAARRLGFSVDVVTELRAAAQPGLELALFSLLLHTGVRVSEATGADVPDVRRVQGHRVLHVVGKGDKPRTPPVPDGCWSSVAELLDGRKEGAIFLGRDGERMSRFTARRVVRTIGQRAEVHVHPHLFRHTAAVLMILGGAPLRQVQDALGHASLDTTAQYQHGLLSLDKHAVYALEKLLAADGRGAA